MRPTKTRNRNGQPKGAWLYAIKNNGERFTTATYTVLLEEQELPESEQIRLTDRSGKKLGEFSLIAPPETLEAVGEIRILI